VSRAIAVESGIGTTSELPLILLRDLEDNLDIDQSLLAAAMKLAQQPRHGQNQSHRAVTDGDQ
jgi:hypothetical protein